MSSKIVGKAVTGGGGGIPCRDAHKKQWTLLLSPGGLSWGINQHSCLHPFECHGNTTNEARPLQRLCDFHGK